MALSAIGIKKASDGRLGDGNGLELHKRGDRGKWVWRYSLAGRRREMGLGVWPDVSLAEARRERDRWALVLSRGLDPITERKASKEALRAEIEKADPTLEQLCRDVLETRKATLRSDGTRGRWLSPLETHVFPRIGRKPISTIHQSDIKAALSSIWRKKHPTAEKAIQRLRIVFRQGKLMGYQCDPFTVDAAQHMLGHVLHTAVPIAATPWQEMPNLYSRLDNTLLSGACLQFMALTLVRLAGCRSARFEEFDGDIWTVPAERMKGQIGQVRDFRVPLSAAAQDLVEKRRALGGEYLFAGTRGRPITDAAVSKWMKEQGEVGRPHGFRTSFRTWVQDTEATSWEVAETILAHVISEKVERSYARSDLLERRRPVMEAWARHVTGNPSNALHLAHDK